MIMIPMVREERRWYKLECENEASNVIIRTSVFKKMEEMYFFILYINYNLVLYIKQNKYKKTLKGREKTDWLRDFGTQRTIWQ